MEVFFRKVGPVGTPRHPGNQSAARVGEGLPGIAVAISGIAHGLCHRHAGVGFARLHQVQRPQVVGSVAGQYLHGGDQLGAGVHHNRPLVPVEAPVAALVPMAHLRVMHRHHPVPAHPILEAHSPLSPFHVLEQQLPQQFRRRHNPLALSAFLPQFPLRLPRQLQQPVRVGHNPSQQRRPRLPVGPVDGRLALHAGAQVSLMIPGPGPIP